MKRKINFKVLLLVIFGVVLFNSCRNNSNTEADFSFKAADFENATTYVSSDKNLEFKLVSNPDSSDGIITLFDVKSNTSYNLKRVPSASGIKYENEEGWVFWTKNDDFIWYQGDREIAKGALKTTEISPQNNQETVQFNSLNYGNYATESYSKKDLGYDWVGVKIIAIDDYHVKVSIRSRVDKKKATCTFDGIADVINANTLKLYENGTGMRFNFEGKRLAISAETESGASTLAFYCSGGASLADEYIKIDGDFDSSQIDKTGYVKTLFYNEYLFVIRENQGNLEVRPIGLSSANEPLITEISGSISNVEIDDLNKDTFPEILIYTQNEPEAFGKVYGYSVNNGKSISMLGIPDIQTLSDVNSGYQGHDEFAMVEGTFVQRFPVYSNGKATGKTRQIQYVLEDGETMRQLVVDKVVEY
ncbi:MliC family protein [Formosa sp. S-31]|uniref:MliC family protein n=1 Tax=Formosa sp. S-31 TaxID=2790949 RepID=UPI003EBFD519